MIEVKALLKIFADGDNAGVRAVNEISFTVEEGRFYTLLGPSGCGKTTTLAVSPALRKPTQARFWWPEPRFFPHPITLMFRLIAGPSAWFSKVMRSGRT